MVVLTFCLYHSPHPAQALAAIVDHLAEDGTLVITTKSADSYHEIDKTIAACTLDPGATHRPSPTRASTPTTPRPSSRRPA